MDDPVALRIAVVGPTHPYKGGVAAHTTTLAHQLAEAGHDVTLVSWLHLYPSLLYPGEEPVLGGEPEVTPFPRTTRPLSWARPDTWIRTGRALRGADVVIVVHVIPAVVPCHLALLRALGASRTSSDRHGSRTIVIAHNVLPHESHPGDSQLMRVFFRRIDTVLVHTAEEAAKARELEADHVVVADLPPHLPGGAPVERVPPTGQTRLLCLGLVRGYKGIDVLLRAMMTVPGVSLTVAGEMWGEAGDTVRRLAADPRLRGRVEVHGGYVPAERLAELMARHDVLALPYRSATASQNALLGQQHGMVVLASDVGTFGQDVRDDVDGLLVPPADEEALAAALRRLADPAELARLRAGVRPPDLSGPWARYVGTIEALSSVDALAAPEWEDDSTPAAPTGPRAALTRGLTDVRRSVAARRRRIVELSRTDLPTWVRPTDVLGTEEEAKEARDLARRLHLPRSSDPVAAWAALGALAAILRVRDDGHRSALIVDASGTASPFVRWARAIGFAPIEIELVGTRPHVSSMDIDTASLDVVTRLHPSDCEPDDIDEVLYDASWSLRTGGLLILTLAVGGQHEAGAITPADLRAVLARADDIGFVLVGDLDGDVTQRLARAAKAATDEDAAYAVVRLTFRRR
ncbi:MULTISPECIES: glycosyltransferase [unclassified Janibacter]|uniref:glycosyltransferase n=1 Tax=unclassified Janibacter TaxID=2649294 RepID=UPI003CFF2A4B